MIALGGAIGTGIFLAMGGTIHQAGVGGAFTAYAIVDNGVLPLYRSW